MNWLKLFEGMQELNSQKFVIQDKKSHCEIHSFLEIIYYVKF